MGSFAIWNILISGLLFVVFLAVVGAVVYFLVRKSPISSSAEAISASGSSEARDAASGVSRRSVTQKIIAISYLVGGIFGVITLLPQLNGVSLDLMSALAWLILLVQIAVAIYGGWQFWSHRPIGAQLLYWLSWSCVPVISFSLIFYWCAMGLAFIPTVAFGPASIGTDVSFRFGYAANLFFNPGYGNLLIGVNVVALIFVLVIAKHMREAGIPKWPLLQANV